MSKSTKCRVLLLAAGALLGCVAAAGVFPAANPVRAQAGDQKAVIVITVRLPADAVLLIDEHPTKESGAVRTFQTPPLPMGGHYAYTLKATSGDKEVTRKIHLAHGVDSTFDLRAEFLPAAKDRVHPKQFIGSGSQDTSTGYVTAIWGASLRTIEEALDSKPPDRSRFPK